MNQQEIEGRWVEKKLNVKFAFDDLVMLLSGDRVGEIGHVVALWTLEPEPQYVIELPDGTSENAIQSSLRAMDPAERPR